MITFQHAQRIHFLEKGMCAFFTAVLDEFCLLLMPYQSNLYNLISINDMFPIQVLPSQLW